MTALLTDTLSRIFQPFIILKLLYKLPLNRLTFSIHVAWLIISIFSIPYLHKLVLTTPYPSLPIQHNVHSILLQTRMGSMGSCLSSSTTYHYNMESNGQSSFRTASVISANGDLRQYTLPVAVSQILRETSSSSSSSSSSGKSFVCDSDGLSYNEYMEAMEEEEQLEEDHIYFLLPASKLQYRLAASEMAALAVKAALALQKSSSNSNKKPKAASSSNSFLLHHHRRHPSSQNKMARISPLADDHANDPIANHQTVGGGNYGVHNPKKGLSNKQAPVGVSRSGSMSMRKLQRYSSRRAKTVVRSFRIRLSTIHEGSILPFY